MRRRTIRTIPQREPYGFELLDELRKSMNGGSGRERLVADQLHRWIDKVIHEAARVGQLIWQLHLYGDSKYTRLYHAYDQLCREHGITIQPAQGKELVLVVRLATQLLSRATSDAFCQTQSEEARECYQTAHILSGFVFEQTEQLSRFASVEAADRATTDAALLANAAACQAVPGP